MLSTLLEAKLMFSDKSLNLSKISVQVQFDVDFLQRCETIISRQREDCTVSSLNRSDI